jgi:murein L,D-transpeptidase YafK
MKEKILPIILLTSLISACDNKKSIEFDTFIAKNEWNNAVGNVVMRYENMTKSDLAPYFIKANLSYPPKEIAILAFKHEKKIELWAKSTKLAWHHIKNFPLKATSGHLGPKINRNDGQIPEGFYQVKGFNPYSAYHLSMMLNYPNAFDKYQAKQDGRYDIGDNIFIHGKDLSAGCLAIGDKGIDELFTLVNKVGKQHTQIIISPNDMRKAPPPPTIKNSKIRWLPGLYKRIALKLAPFREV